MEDNDICIDSEKDDPLQIFVDVGLNYRFIRDCKGISKAPLTLSGEFSTISQAFSVYFWF